MSAILLWPVHPVLDAMTTRLCTHPSSLGVTTVLTSASTAVSATSPFEIWRRIPAWLAQLVAETVEARRSTRSESLGWYAHVGPAILETSYTRT